MSAGRPSLFQLRSFRVLGIDGEFQWERQGLTRFVFGRIRVVYYRSTWRALRPRKAFVRLKWRNSDLGWIFDIWNLRVIWENSRAW